MEKKKKGFTLVEMMVVIVLLAVFGAIVLSIAISSGKLFGMVQKTSIITDDGRIVISKLEDDLRKATNIKESSGTLTSIIDYNGENYTLPVVSKIILAYTIKEGGSNNMYAYTQSALNKEVKRYQLLSGGTLKAAGSYIWNVSSFNISREVATNRYMLNISFDDGENKAEYKSTITPRN